MNVLLENPFTCLFSSHTSVTMMMAKPNQKYWFGNEQFLPVKTRPQSLQPARGNVYVSTKNNALAPFRSQNITKKTDLG